MCPREAYLLPFDSSQTSHLSKPRTHLSFPVITQVKWRPTQEDVCRSNPLNVCLVADFMTALKEIEAQLKDIVQNLFNLMVQGYDHQGPKTQDAIKREVYGLVL